MKLTRRSFVGAVGGTAGLIGAMGLSRYFIFGDPEPRESSFWPNHEESFVPSVCRACPAGCGIRGRIVDGRLVRVEGNALHPISRGGLCPKGVASLQMPHDPDRPLSCGARQSNVEHGRPLHPLSGTEAIDLLAERIRMALDSRGPRGVAIVEDTGYSGTSLVLQSLAAALNLEGTWRCDPDAGLRLAVEHTQGINARPAYDLANADAVLVFGSGFLEDDASPLRRALDLADLRGRGEGRRPQFFAIEPRYSMSAARADRWIPIRPGSYGSLALGIAYVVLREGRHAATFIRESCEAHEDVALSDGTQIRGYRRMVLEDGRPEVVSQVTGVPVDDILKIGKAFAAARRAIAVPTRQLTWHRGGVRAAALVHALNALVGNIDLPGGVLTPLSPPLALPANDSQREGAGDSQSFLLDIAEGRRPAPSVLILAEIEPQESPGEARAWDEVRERVPFIASIAAKPGPSVASADLVLPAATFLESWDLWYGPNSLGVSVVGVAQPLVAPPVEARPTAEWAIAIAAKLAGKPEEALPWSTAEEHVRHQLKQVFNAHRGAPFTKAIEGEHIRELEKRGWWASPHEQFDSFFDAATAAGGWWDPFYRHQQLGRVLRNPTGRFRFPMDMTPRAASLLSYVAIPETGTQIQLNPFPVLAFAGRGGAESPWMQQIADSFGRVSWDDWVELNPATAADLGLVDEQQVEVGNRRGSFRARLMVFEGAMPGILNVPIGYSPTSGGRYASGRGAELFRLLDRARDPVSGFACLTSATAWVRAV